MLDIIDPAKPLAETKVETVVVRSPVAGTLALPTLKDQEVTVGGEIATVSPGTLSVSGTLTPDQQYRLVGAPQQASVTLNGGPAPFECTGLHVGAAPQTGTGTSGAPADPGAGGSAPSSGTVSCAIPADVTAFAGLGATVEITNGSAQDVVVVPISAVQGTIQNGNVWVVAADGSNARKPIKLGLTDGKVVQVTEGLAKGDTVLEFIPVPGGQGQQVDCTQHYDPTVCGG